MCRKMAGVVLMILAGGLVTAQDAPPSVTPEQVRQGAEIYANNCATCHGNRMKNPEWAIDLATIPKDDRMRFVQSVTNGKNNMPPWGDVLKPQEIEALYAYFAQGEK
jgi:mono/diheme cytochrome c family protein